MVKTTASLLLVLATLCIAGCSMLSGGEGPRPYTAIHGEDHSGGDFNASELPRSEGVALPPATALPVRKTD